jgi:predicted PurR-regulated permease PerM
MNLLLDTHAFLWFIANDSRLSNQAQSLIQTPTNRRLISMASLWEMAHQGSTGWGIFMLVWGVGVSSVDNVVKPGLISQGSDTPFILIFFGVLGGALAFGSIGVFLGPTLLAVGFSLVEEWASINRAAPDEIKNSEP